MTHDEMRRRLAEAMGWMDIVTPGERPRMGEDVTGIPPEGNRPGYRTEIPDPLEDDRDAARLRAWCVERGWTVRTDNEPASEWVHGGAWPAAHVKVVRAPIVESSLVREREEPDPCRRERLALCRAVLQVVEAGGEA